MKKISLLALAVAMLGVTQAAAATLLFDFGDSTNPAGGNYNHVISAVSVTTPDVIDSLGNLTGIELVTSGFHEFGGNNDGTAAPLAPADLFVANATRDSLYGHTTNWGSATPRETGTLIFTGLDGSGATTYDFSFFASRMGVGDNRETLYSVAGLNGGSDVLNSSNNTSNVANVAGIVPTAGGSITISVTKGPNNNNGSGFFYLGAMQVTSTTVPEPTTFGLFSVAGLMWAVRRR